MTFDIDLLHAWLYSMDQDLVTVTVTVIVIVAICRLIRFKGLQGSRFKVD